MPYKDRETQREYQRQWTQARRVAWLKANGPCRRCGSEVDLQVDHVDSTQKIDHRVWSWSDERRVAELAKCQVLCKHCHSQKTVTEFQPAPAHGTQARYTGYKHRCKCGPCTEAHRQTVAFYRANPVGRSI